ncbi:MAG: alpha/beta hydrolase [Bacteroidales bacterium]|nr:alpha/beta hydrolase [Bacteroidales bacterium]
MKKEKKRYKVLRILGIILLVLILMGTGLILFVNSHPQAVVGLIQKALYGDNPINSFEPFNEPGTDVKSNGILYVHDIKYGNEYPNSYLDISYPNEDTAEQRPTVIYFHGGGYFGGDKAMGDPLAVDNEFNILLDAIVKEGYNFINVNYALVPDYHFPVPLIQMNQAVNFLVENGREYGLDMDNVVIMGGSAGAIMTSQYGALLANEDYRNDLNIHPFITKYQVKALVIDDAALIPANFNFRARLLFKSYFGVTNLKKSELLKVYNPIPYVNGNYPPSFLNAGNVGGFPDDMETLSKVLTSYGINNEFYYRDKSYGELPHGYLNLINTNRYAKECFDRMLAFMNKYTK